MGSLYVVLRGANDMMIEGVSLSSRHPDGLSPGSLSCQDLLDPLEPLAWEKLCFAQVEFDFGLRARSEPAGAPWRPSEDPEGIPIDSWYPWGSIGS